MSSNSFSWKEIEEKPANAETARLLIESAVSSPTKNVSEIKQPLYVLEEFIQKKETKRWFPNFKLEKKDGKSKVQNKKDKIREKVEKNKIKSDLDLFSLNDDLSLRTPAFFFPINNYLYILWWCHELLTRIEEKKKGRMNPLLLLDATLSIDRLLDKGIITEPAFLEGFKAISKEANSYMNANFYQLLFQNPKMILSCSFQNSSKEISLYKEQKVILNTIQDAVDKNTPLLLGNQLPTGQGKTFLATVIAKMFSTNRSLSTKKCVLFACSNELVNMDVASCSLLGSDVHLWMAKLIRESGKNEAKVLVRPYKSCFPNTWKKVYKRKEDDKMKSGSVVQQWNYYSKETGRIPDIIVCDLNACEKLLEVQKLLNNPFVAYIDEFISDDKSNRLMANICEMLPRQTVLLSSVLPKFEYIPSIVHHFCEMHHTTKDECCKRVSAVDISIPCCVVDKDGKIRFPHHEIETKEHLAKLIEEMKTNPRIRRTYSPQHVYYWMKELHSILPAELSFKRHFPNIGSIQMRKVTEYVLHLLEYLYEHFDLLEKFKEYRPQVFEPIKKEAIFEAQCYMYEPKTLMITNHPLPTVSTLTEKLFDKSKIPKLSKLLKEIDNKRDSLQNKLESLKKVKSSSSAKVNVVNMEDQQREITEELNSLQLRIPQEYQLNHVEHYKRYHEIEGTTPKSIGFPPSIYIDDKYIDAFSDDEIYQLMSGIGTYDVQCQTEFQRKLTMKLYQYLSFLVSGKEIVYGTNLSSLINIFIDNDFAEHVSISELYQLMGRVGRVGRSYHANIITTDEVTVKRLLSLEDNVEKENEIETIFHKNKVQQGDLLDYYNESIKSSKEKFQYQNAISVYNEMSRKGVKKNTETYQTILSVFQKVNNVEGVNDVLEEMRLKGVKDATSYRIMIHTLKENALNRRANILLDELKEFENDV